MYMLRKFILVLILIFVIAALIIVFTDNPDINKSRLVKVNSSVQSKKKRYTKEELESVSPLELIKSSLSDDRVSGYKRMATEMDVGSDPKLVAVIFSAIEKEINADTDVFPYPFWPLDRSSQLDENTMNKLFELLEHDDPKIWYEAVRVLTNRNSLGRWVKPEAFIAKKNSLQGIALLRFGLSSNFKIMSLTSEAYSFLIFCTTDKMHTLYAEVFSRACHILVDLDCKKASPVLAKAILDFHKNKKTQESWLAPLIALKAINKLQDTNYGSVGKDLSFIDSDTIKKVNWSSIAIQLKLDFMDLPKDKTHNQK